MTELPDAERKFRQLADRFRRINAADPDAAMVEIESASAQGARLLKAAIDAEVIDPAVFAMSCLLRRWPASAERMKPGTVQKYAVLWTGFCLALSESAKNQPDLPLDLMGRLMNTQATAECLTPGFQVAAVQATVWRPDPWRLRAEGFADVCEWLAGKCRPASIDTLPAVAPGRPPVVDLQRRTVTLGGTAHDVKSEKALRWVAVLAKHPGEWISGPRLADYDDELMDARPDKLKPFLPQTLLALIDSETGKGSRLRTIPPEA